MVRFRYLALVLAASAAVFTASVVSACPVDGGVVAPVGAAVYAPQAFAPAYAPAFVPQFAPVYAAPQRVVVQRQVSYAPAVVAAPVVKQRVVVRNRAPIFRGRRAAVVVGAGAAVAY
jgi:hypothetical protein